MLRKVGNGNSDNYYLVSVLRYEMLVGTPPYFASEKEQLSIIL